MDKFRYDAGGFNPGGFGAGRSRPGRRGVGRGDGDGPAADADTVPDFSGAAAQQTTYEDKYESLQDNAVKNEREDEEEDEEFADRLWSEGEQRREQQKKADPAAAPLRQERNCTFQFFDFRGGRAQWPKSAHIVSQERAKTLRKRHERDVMIRAAKKPAKKAAAGGGGLGGLGLFGDSGDDDDDGDSIAADSYGVRFDDGDVDLSVPRGRIGLLDTSRQIGRRVVWTNVFGMGRCETEGIVSHDLRSGMMEVYFPEGVVVEGFSRRLEEHQIVPIGQLLFFPEPEAPAGGDAAPGKAPKAQRGSDRIKAGAHHTIIVTTDRRTYRIYVDGERPTSYPSDYRCARAFRGVGGAVPPVQIGEGMYNSLFMVDRLLTPEQALGFHWTLRADMPRFNTAALNIQRVLRGRRVRMELAKKRLWEDFEGERLDAF